MKPTIKTDWRAMLHAETLEWADGTESAQPLREAALAYATSCGWLDPKQAHDLERGVAEAQAVADEREHELATVRAKVRGMLGEIEKIMRGLE